MLILLLFHVSPSSTFFFPMGGGTCQCPVCPQPVTCAPQPTCAIPLPCPTTTSYFAPGQLQTQYQGSYQPVQPFGQSLTVPVPPSPPQLIQPAAVPAYVSPEAQPQSSASYFNPSYYSYTPTYQTIRPAYQTVVPAYEATYLVPEISVTNPVQPIQPVQTEVTTDHFQGDTIENSGRPSYTSASVPSIASQYIPEPPDHTSIVAFDETAPVIPPPVPTEPSSYSSSSAESKATTNDITGIAAQDNEAQLVPAAGTAATSAYDDRRSVAERWSAYQQSLHSGSTDVPWVAIPYNRRISTEVKFCSTGNVSQAPHDTEADEECSPASCNCPSNKYDMQLTQTCERYGPGKILGARITSCAHFVQVMVDDVSISKRTILRATEMAFDGDKFDVFCARGEFSYSIHSRKYCEITKDDVTCFAFR